MKALELIFGRIGEVFLKICEEIGGIFIVLSRIIAAFFPPRFDGRETWRNLYKVGVKSYPIVIMTAFFVGAIMVIQSGHFVKKTGATEVVPYASGFAVFAEFGPVLIGLMFSGRVGANNAAELGTMKVTEQIDALRALAINPMQYLVVPRFFSMIVMLVLLTVIGDAFALLGAAIVSDTLLGVSMKSFLYGILKFNFMKDFILGLVKAFVFGVSISVISCHFGLSVTGGAPGVGRAVNASVVAAALGIFALDYIILYMATLFGYY